MEHLKRKEGNTELLRDFLWKNNYLYLNFSKTEFYNLLIFKQLKNQFSIADKVEHYPGFGICKL